MKPTDDKAKIIRLASYPSRQKPRRDPTDVDLSRLLSYVEELNERIDTLERANRKLVRILTDIYKKDN